MKKPSKKKWWLILALLILIGLGVGGYYYLSESSHADKEWNPLSSKCRFDMDIPKKQKEQITEIVTTVSGEGYFALLGKKGHLNKIGDEVDKKVSSLQFWAYIFSQPELAQGMKKISKDSMKFGDFLTNSLKNLTKAEQQNSCFYQQVEGFAKYLKINPEKTKSLLKECLEKGKSNNKALEPFIRYLIEQKAS